MPKKKICAVIPAFNEEKVLELSLNSLKKIIPKENIFVVSDGSKDKTAKIARHAQVNSMALRQNVGKAQAIEKLIKSRKLTHKYRFCLFSDADSQLEKSFLVKLKSTLKTKPACTIGIITSQRRGLISAYRVYEYSLSHNIYKNAQNILGAITVAPGCASIYRSDVLNKLNFSNRTLTEDFDLTLQIHQNKLGRVAYVSGAKVTTQDPETFRDYWNQITRWFTGFWQNFFIHKLYLPNKKINFIFYSILLDLVAWIVLIFLIVYHPTIFLRLLTWMIMIILFSGFMVSILKQFWAILYSPLFPLFYFINLVAFILSFFRVILSQNRSLSWKKVARYRA